MEDNMTTQNPGTGDKTFTQDDVNRIIGERLAKEKTKGDTDFSKKEQELAQREIRLSAKEMLSDSNLPVQLIDALNCTSKETLEKSISIIEKVFNEIKKEAPNRQMKGASPADPHNRLDEVNRDDGEDAAIRKAMGLQ